MLDVIAVFEYRIQSRAITKDSPSSLLSNGHSLRFAFEVSCNTAAEK